MVTKSLSLKRMSARIPEDLQERLNSKVFAIKSIKHDFTIEQAVAEALEDWLKKVSKVY